MVAPSCAIYQFCTATHPHQYVRLSLDVYDVSDSTVHTLCGQCQQNSSCSNQVQHLLSHSLAVCPSVRVDAVNSWNSFYSHFLNNLLTRYECYYQVAMHD